MTDIPAIDRVFCAVDTPNLDEAVLLAELLAGEVGGIKLGKEFFTAQGPDGLRRVASFGHRIFLDLKYHDIPNTVAGAVRAAAGLGCAFVNVHASGGPAMLKAAVKAADDAGADRPKLLAVTVLTSLDEDDLAAVGQTGPADQQVLRLARLAEQCGMDGVVCSPRETTMLRDTLGDHMVLMTPGVRPDWSSADDQKRVMTPGDAVAAGSDYVVLGRPIRTADDPVGAARRVVAEIEDLAKEALSA